MGLSYSQQSLRDEINSVLEYICAASKLTLCVDPNVKLTIRESTLPSSFIDGQDMGTFTENFIPKGTIVLEVNDNIPSKMNDGVIDLGPILQANTSEDTYRAWTNMKRRYYNTDVMSKVINTRMVVDTNNIRYYETIQDIPAGGELVRVYGFTTWTFELFDTLTNKNIVGFAHFINDLLQNIAGDPYEYRINKLHESLKLYNKDFFTMDRSSYDDKMTDAELISLGDIIKGYYLMVCLDNWDNKYVY